MNRRPVVQTISLVIEWGNKSKLQLEDDSDVGLLYMLIKTGHQLVDLETRNKFHLQLDKYNMWEIFVIAILSIPNFEIHRHCLNLI